MKIYNETKLTIVGKAEPGTGQDGKTLFYKVACMQNFQATNLSVTKEVYDVIPDGMVEGVFATVWDDKYGSLKIDGLTSIQTVNGRPFEKAAATPEKASGGK